MNNAVQNILSKIDQLKSDVAQIDEQTLDSIESAPLLYVSYVFLDESKDETEVYLCIVDGTEADTKLVYRGCSDVAEVIVGNLLKVFDGIHLCGFREDGEFWI